jgi:hypothetical protein
MLDYTNKYRCTYKRVIKEAKRIDNDKYILRAVNKTKGMWQVINKEVGRAVKHDNKIELHVGSNIISDPQAGADMLKKTLCRSNR